MSDDNLYKDFELEVDNAVKSRYQYERKKFKRGLIIGSVIIILIIIGTVVGITVSRKVELEGSGTHPVKATHGCKSFSRPATILVILDGFKPAYLKEKYSPNINKLAKFGVQAEGMRSQFPTDTYPNIGTILTGLFPESHGIVGNVFWNGNRTEKFSYLPKKGQKSHWYLGDPIWVTAQQQGVKSAVYYYADVNSNLGHSRHPDYYVPHDGGKKPYEDRVDKVLSWLDMDSSKRPYFISVYFGQPDSASHRYGIDTPQVHQAIKKVDDAVGRLVEGLMNRSLNHCTNIVLVSDHGMVNISCSRVLYLDQMISLKNIIFGSTLHLYTKSKAQTENITNQMKCKHANLRIFSKYDGFVPKRLHFTNSKRIGDVIVMPSLGWQAIANTGKCPTAIGGHGFDNINLEMQALFIGHGPSFKKGIIVPQFPNVELYNLFTELLKLRPAPNNGTIGSLSHLLQNPKSFVRTYDVGDGNSFSMDCTFPKNLTEAMAKCKDYICPYCFRSIEQNITFYTKNLNLSTEELRASLQRHFPWGLPKGGAGKGGCILTQKHYVIGYSSYLHIPLWVGYHLTAKQLRVNIPRKNCFRRDIRLTSQNASLCIDYSRSGFDRGHMAPNGDFNFERSAEQDTNILSNIAPQHRYFNRYPGIWFRSEDLFRRWALEYNSVYVISGSIFDSDGDGLRDKDGDAKRWLKDIKNSVAIPTHFYKIIVRCISNITSEYKFRNCKGTLESLSFVFPHNMEKDCKLHAWQTRMLEYTASIRDIERLTGQNLFPDLPHPFSAQFKTHLPTKLWPIP
eukprot:gene9672-10658_t